MKLSFILIATSFIKSKGHVPEYLQLEPKSLPAYLVFFLFLVKTVSPSKSASMPMIVVDGNFAAVATAYPAHLQRPSPWHTSYLIILLIHAATVRFQAFPSRFGL